MAEQGFTDVFFRHVCERRRSMNIVLALIAVTFCLMLVSLFVTEPGTPTYIVTVMNLVGLVFFGLLFIGLLLVCRSRDGKRSWK